MELHPYQLLALYAFCISICWSLLSNQSFYRQIAGYGMGVGDHRVGQ